MTSTGSTHWQARLSNTWTAQGLLCAAASPLEEVIDQ